MKSGTPDFLCEGCGYVLGGLDRSGACPECGRPIAQSMHTSRPGTPWQQLPGVWSWLRTGVLTIAKPSHVFSIVRFDAPLARRQLTTSLCIGTALLLTPGLWAWFVGPAKATIQTGPTAFQIFTSLGVVSLILAIAPAGVFGWSYALTPRAYRARGWRITRSVYLTIAAHASFAWILAGLFVILANFAERALMNAAPGMTNPATAIRLASLASSAVNLGLAMGVAVLVWLEYTGLRLNRYANPPELFPQGAPPSGGTA
jgi:hypothetical protein